MSQQINFYHPIFRKQRLSLTSANAMLYGVGVAALLTAMVGLYEDHELRVIQAQARDSEQQLNDATALHQKLTGQVQQKPDPQIEREMAQLSAKLKERQDIVETLNQGALGNMAGFSEYMRAFARQSISGLWLTAFDISGSELTLQGRAVSADLISSYLKKLNEEKALQGRQFASMRIDQPIKAIEQTAQDNAKAQATSREPQRTAPRYLEFTISTLEMSDDGKQVPRVAALESPSPGAFDAGSKTRSAAEDKQ